MSLDSIYMAVSFDQLLTLPQKTTTKTTTKKAPGKKPEKTTTKSTTTKKAATAKKAAAQPKANTAKPRKASTVVRFLLLSFPCAQLTDGIQGPCRRRSTQGDRQDQVGTRHQDDRQTGDHQEERTQEEGRYDRKEIGDS